MLAGGGLMANVFISYSRDTKPLAEKLARSLNRNGISTWTGFDDLKPGQRWSDEMEKALEAARDYVVLVGPDEEMSTFQDRELQAALRWSWSDSAKRIIPVIVGRERVPPFLSDWVGLKVGRGQDETLLPKKLLSLLRDHSSSHSSPPHSNLARRNRLKEIEEFAQADKIAQER
jgi:hypothetical protein